MLQILSFLARGIGRAPEFDVAPDLQTGPIVSSPRATLQVEVSDQEPVGNVPTALLDGRYFSLNDTPWDRASFMILNVLFQTTVGDIDDVGIPITIAK